MLPSIEFFCFSEIIFKLLKNCSHLKRSVFDFQVTKQPLLTKIQNYSTRLNEKSISRCITVGLVSNQKPVVFFPFGGADFPVYSLICASVSSGYLP